MDLKELNAIAEELESYIIGSNGVEIYRIQSKVTLRWPPELERAFQNLEHFEEGLKMIILDVYIHAAQRFMKKYSWIDGLNRVDFEDGLDLRTDYPVLDMKNKLVLDPGAAKKRLQDLNEIRKLVDDIFRDAKKHMAKPEFSRKYLRSIGMGVFS
jgi:hypothetical protein